MLHQLEKSFLASGKDFKRIIDDIPRTLLSTYNIFLIDIPAQYQSLAAKLLPLLIASSRPLSLDGIKTLVAIQGTHHSLANVKEELQPNIQETLEGILGPLVSIWDGWVYPVLSVS